MILSYSSLNQQANRLAHYLREYYQLVPGKLVGVMLDRSEEVIIAILAVIKAGAAYVPLNPNLPQERLQYIVEDNPLMFVLSSQKYSQLAGSLTGEIVLIDTHEHNWNSLPAYNPAPAARPGDLMYVMYTSGSTGKPKGVPIRHRSVMNFLYHMQSRPGISSADRVIFLAAYSFDISVLEIFLPLISGATVIVAPAEAQSDPQRLQEIFENYHVTIAQGTPTTWSNLIYNGCWKGMPGLKVLCGGEVLGFELGRHLLKRCESLWNMYGPTETTVWPVINWIQEESDLRSIGRPIANTQIYILDENLQLLPIGSKGEICIGGEGVAGEYLNRPELNEKYFIPNPFGKPGLLYRSGDLGYWLEDGQLVYCGRKDQQVKIRGHRIELGEIEHHMQRFPGVENAVVLAAGRSNEDKLLFAFITGLSVDMIDLKTFLRRFLPEYMVPSVIEWVEALPLMANGKVDRKKLPTPRSEPLQKWDNTQPRTAKESVLAGIWKRLLSLERISMTDNFFDIGGHSIKATQLLAEIQQEFLVRLELRDIFLNPTLESQVSLLRERSSELLQPTAPAISPLQKKPRFFRSK